MSVYLFHLGCWTMSDMDEQRLPDAVRARRKQLGLKQAEAAALADMAPSTWASVEQGRQPSPAIDTRRGICRALGWTPDSIDRVLRGEPTQLADVPNVPNPRGIRTLDQRFEDLTPKQQDAIRAAFDAFEAGA
jgi:transcriptional regulator with XRE-family HTH domain